MNFRLVTIVRVYLTDHSAQLDPLLRRLHDWERVRGVTVFHGAAGFGENSGTGSVKLTAQPLHTPVVVEFFDIPEKISAVLEHISINIKPRHMVWWNVMMHDEAVEDDEAEDDGSYEE